MNELNDLFKEYIDEVKKLDTKGKRMELMNSIVEIITTYLSLAEKNGIELNYLTNKEVLDFKNGEETEDDFLEAALVYVEIAKNLIGEYELKTK